ncbi:MAG: glycosyltransferase family protein [Jhaorihella sp.]
MKVMIAVTHLLGTGHLSRALTLGRAFAGAGHRVLLASGGMPAPHLECGNVEVVHLPPLRSDGTDFARLLDAGGALAGADYMDRRTTALCRALSGLTPDILITELFPFGRRSLGAEFLALLEAAGRLPRRPVVLASVRDILAPPSRPAKAEHADALIASHYDAVLVHSDPQTTPLSANWPVSDMLAGKLRYTGYVCHGTAVPHPDGDGAGEILVSAGGGAVGGPVFAAAIGAARLMPGLTWRLLVGGDDSALAAVRRAAAGTGVTVEPPRSDFRQMLHHARASVSMCGYNTALDLLQAGTPAVLIPFDAGNEVEQGLRAQSLAALPGIEVLAGADLTAQSLADTLARAIGDGPRQRKGGFDGAARSVAIACAMAEARP